MYGGVPLDAPSVTVRGFSPAPLFSPYFKLASMRSRDFTSSSSPWPPFTTVRVGLISRPLTFALAPLERSTT